MKQLLTKVFGDGNSRQLKKLEKVADQIEELEPQMQQLSDYALQEKTDEFKKRYQDGESLDDLLPEAYAVVREASKRVLGMRPFYVQLLGAIALHQGDIAEMKTGEGKTLASTMPAYLNAITGKGVHIITVNDYLADRDSNEMGELYNWLGLTVGLNTNSLSKTKSVKHTPKILRMVRIMNSALIIYAIIWCYIKKKWCSDHFILRSLTRLTRF